MKKAALWLAAIVITLAAAYFQRGTGPTKPVYAKFTFEGKEYQTSLPRIYFLIKKLNFSFIMLRLTLSRTSR